MDSEEARRLVEKMVMTLARVEPEDYSGQLPELQFVRIDESGSYALHAVNGVTPRSDHGVVVDAEATDLDGATIFALLHVRRGSLAELEVFRGDSAVVTAPLSANAFEVVYPHPGVEVGS